MIGTIVRIEFLNLARDRIALALTFVLPIVFFTIFAAIFGNMSGGAMTESVRLVLADLDESEASERLVQVLIDDPSLQVTNAASESMDQFDDAAVRDYIVDRVRGGDFPVGIIIRNGFGETFGDFTGDAVPIEVLYDASDPVAHQMVAGLLQGAAMSAAPDLLMQRGVDALAEFGGGLSEQQKAAIETAQRFLRGEIDFQADDSQADGAEADDAAPSFAGPIEIVKTDVHAGTGDESTGRSLIAYYAAGIGVMFLLFAMSGAAGTFLDEEQTGSLERLLSSRATMWHIMLGKWGFYTIVGVVEMIVMFVWGNVFFGMPLWSMNTLVGFSIMTIIAAAAASAFGIVLATLCRSRAQLGGISTIVILVMSALGGSMVPQFIMPPIIRDVFSKFTFNGWALEGYLDVFWHADPSGTLGALLIAITVPVLILAALTVAFLLLARVLARRWEIA